MFALYCGAKSNLCTFPDTDIVFPVLEYDYRSRCTGGSNSNPTGRCKKQIYRQTDDGKRCSNHKIVKHNSNDDNRRKDDQGKFPVQSKDHAYVRGKALAALKLQEEWKYMSQNTRGSRNNSYASCIWEK